MESFLNKKDFLKLGLFSGISSAGATYLMWLVVSLFESWDPHRYEVIMSAAWSTSIGMFFNLLIFSSLLGFATKFLQSKSRVILGTFVVAGLISGILLNMLSDFRMIDFSVIVGFVIPLSIFYRTFESKQWYNWIKLVSLVIIVLIIYEYVTLNLFTGNMFQYFRSPFKRWLYSFIAYGPPLIVTVYIYHKTLGRFYQIDEEIGKMKLKEFIKLFYKKDIEYTFSKDYNTFRLS